jgi:uncharacterized membrane protein YciS (DUF1049 family)
VSPELSGFALGLLVGAAKVLGIAAVGFGIAWWRARLRIKSLEAELKETEAALEELSLPQSLEAGSPPRPLPPNPIVRKQ